MRSKRITVLTLIFAPLFTTSCRRIPLKKDYNAELISVIKNHEETTVQDVFSFDFDRAYVFYLEDCYFSGEAFARAYNLDITIPEVDSAASEQIQRIVFVDISGNFVYEFQCYIGDVVFEKTGIVIYPETVIKRKSSAQERTLTIDFQSSEFLKKAGDG